MGLGLVLCVVVFRLRLVLGLYSASLNQESARDFTRFSASQGVEGFGVLSLWASQYPTNRHLGSNFRSVFGGACVHGALVR